MLISFGMEKSQFANTYFESNFYVHRGAISTSTITWEDINTILYCTEPRAPFIKLHKNGLVPEDQYIESYSEIGFPRKRIIKQVLYDHMKDGATIVLNRVETKSPTIKQLCMEVARFVDAQTLANGYLAFSGNGTFGNHWDTHDVFAIQLIGKKRWKIYAPTFSLPVPSQTSKMHKQECPEEPVFDGILEAGDLLYIPRGWWHNALPVGEETFHVAVGVHTANVVTYATWLSANVLPKFIECRKSLRVAQQGQQEIANAMEVIKTALMDPENLSRFSKFMAESERVVSPFSIEKFGRPLSPDVNPETVIKLNSSYPVIQDSTPVVVNGATADLNEPTASLISAITVSGSISMEDLSKKIDLPQEELGRLVHDLACRDLITVIS